jgi:Tfp pilus assembly protein PilE
MITIKSKNYGYTLMELLFYISFFSIISLLVINSLIIMTKSFKETTVQAELGDSSSIMERMSREIRKASNISTITASDLKLDTIDDTTSAAKTVEFLLSAGSVQLLEDNILTGNLNTPNITVTGLIFTQITTTASQAVKIHLILKSNNDSLGRTVDFYDTVGLRGSY